MKRKRRDPTPVLLPVFVWTECVGCREEYTFERMWGMVAYYNGEAIPHFVCQHCAPTHHEAKHIMREKQR